MSDWLEQLRAMVTSVDPLMLSTRVPPKDFSGRESAILIAFAEAPDGLELVLIERSHELRAHAGQPAFPGGSMAPDDHDEVATALREAQEEIGLMPQDVTVIGTLPRLLLSVSGFAVTPVIAHWHNATYELQPDLNEVSAVVRVPIRDFVNPANRVLVRHPSGSTGPGFFVAGLLVWGFTGAVISGLLEHLQWAEPWDDARIVPLGSAAP